MKRLLLCVLMLAVPVLAHADTVYSTSSAFTAATTGVTTITFNGIADSSPYYLSLPSTYTLGGVTFTSLGNDLVDIGSPTFYTPYASFHNLYTDGDFLVPGADSAGITDTLTVSFAPSTAVSFNYGGDFGPASIPVVLSDGFTTTLSSSNSLFDSDTLSFAGIITSSPITSITFELPTGGDWSALDNISYGSAANAETSPVPEPSSLVLLLTGVAGAAGIASRRLFRVA